jgi:hypothetical protein
MRFFKRGKIKASILTFISLVQELQMELRLNYIIQKTFKDPQLLKRWRFMSSLLSHLSTETRNQINQTIKTISIAEPKRESAPILQFLWMRFTRERKRKRTELYIFLNI